MSATLWTGRLTCGLRWTSYKFITMAQSTGFTRNVGPMQRRCQAMSVNRSSLQQTTAMNCNRAMSYLRLCRLFDLPDWSASFEKFIRSFILRAESMMPGTEESRTTACTLSFEVIWWLGDDNLKITLCRLSKPGYIWIPTFVIARQPARHCLFRQSLSAQVRQKPTKSKDW